MSDYYQSYLKASLRGDSAAAAHYWSLMEVERRNKEHQRAQLEQSKKQTELLRKQAQAMEEQTRLAERQHRRAEHESWLEARAADVTEQERVDAIENAREAQRRRDLRAMDKRLRTEVARRERERQQERAANDNARKDEIIYQFGKCVLEDFVFENQRYREFDEIDLTPADGMTGFFFEPCPARRKADWLLSLPSEVRQDLRELPIEAERAKAARRLWADHISEQEASAARSRWLGARTTELAGQMLKLRRQKDSAALEIGLDVLIRHEEDHAASVLAEDQHQRDRSTYAARVKLAEAWGSEKPKRPERASTPTEDAQNARIGWAVVLSGVCLLVHPALAAIVACGFVWRVRQQSRLHATIVEQIRQRGQDVNKVYDMLDLTRPFREKARAEAEAEWAAQHPQTS